MFLGLLTFSDTLRHRARSRRWSHDRAIGRRGEDLAHRFLQRSGFTIAARNYRMQSGAGEVDIIGWDRETLVFVEVKTRQSDEFGSPDRAVGCDKLRTMARAARDYTHRADVLWQNVRFDIVNVLMGPNPSVTHLRDVLSMRAL